MVSRVSSYFPIGGHSVTYLSKVINYWSMSETHTSEQVEQHEIGVEPKTSHIIMREYGPYYLHLNVFTASKASNLYILLTITSPARCPIILGT